MTIHPRRRGRVEALSPLWPASLRHPRVAKGVLPQRVIPLIFQRRRYLYRVTPGSGVPAHWLRRVTGETLGLAAARRRLFWVPVRGGLSTPLLTASDDGHARVLQQLGVGQSGQIAYGSGYVYWVTDRGFGRIRRDGRRLDRSFVTMPLGPNGFVDSTAVRGRYLYFDRFGVSAAGHSGATST